MLEVLCEMPKVGYGLSLLTVGYLIYYLRKAVKPPQLICAEGPFRTFIEENVAIIRSKFWPTFWCYEARAQTVLASILRKLLLPHIKYRREILTLKDGGEVALDWADQGCSPTSPIVIILPGLTGSSQTEYIRCLITAAKNVGIRCVVSNNRGLGGVPLKTPRLYCAANYDDFTEVVDHIKKTNPGIPLGATGVSMGGLILGNYLAQHGAAARKKVKAAFIVSVPWNIVEAVKSFEKPYLNLMLNRYLAENLCRNIRRMESSSNVMFSDINVETVLKSRTIKEFDSHFTAKHFGYKDVDDYYENASLHKKLHLIEVPVLCLSAADDPMQPLEGEYEIFRDNSRIPVKGASKSKNVALLVTVRGGHIGWLEGFWPLGEESYIGKLFSQYFDSVFKKMDENIFL
ncbi:phospholipase ABHD3 isoform X1 [Diachasma alloeum]|uniref:phospholipase ABHD3 isoform X1 n=1 Tax=Diachasma alloeum TaxID=454923 RepID=UPI00073823F8|nr:phospholipase ABHD3 isoform X1 [Diachasma alloeum]